MENAALLTLAGLCLGIALSGLLTNVVRRGRLFERVCLGLVFAAFISMVALPLVAGFAQGRLVHFMPVLLIWLLVLPPAFYHYVVARTATEPPSSVPWRDLALPLTGGVVCMGFWTLPAGDKTILLVQGELPWGLWPSVLAFVTFALIVVWFGVSFADLVGILRRLTAYRHHIRQHYSDVETRDLRWVDTMMILLALIWAVGAYSLAADNFFGEAWFVAELFLLLIAAGLLI